MKTKKQDFALMSILKVHEISRIICETNMGVLKLRIRKGEQDYRFVLDSVELPKELHKEIYELLYAPEIPNVGAYKHVKTFTDDRNELNTEGTLVKQLTWNGIPIKSDSKEAKILVDLNPAKPRGRPAGSKNKSK